MTVTNNLQAPDSTLRGRSRGSLSRAPHVETTVGLGEFFDILARRVRTIIIAVALALGLAVVYLMLASTSYTATVSILIDPRERPPVGSDQPAGPQNPDLIMTETQVKLITSEAVLRAAINDLKLYDDPDFGRPGLLGRLLSLVQGETPQAAREQRIRQLILSLGDTSTVRRSERTYLFELDVKARTADKAALLANAIAAAYLQDQNKVNEDYIKRQAAWVNERLIDLQVKVQEAENRAQDYRASNGIVGSSGVLVNEQQMTEAAKQLATARARTAEARGRNDQVRRLMTAGRNIGGLPEALRSTLVEKFRIQLADLTRQEANLRVTFGDRHPALVEVREQIKSSQAQLDAELKRVAEGTYNDLQSAIANEADISRQLSELKKTTTTTNGSLVALRELDREVEANRAVYERFLRARESLRRDVGDPLMARIATPAVPPMAATSPRPLAALIAAVAGGLGAGLATALMQEHRARHRAASLAEDETRAADERPEQGPSISVPPRVDVPVAPRDSGLSERATAVLATRAIQTVPVLATDPDETHVPAPANQRSVARAPKEALLDAIAVLPRLDNGHRASSRTAPFANDLEFLLEVRNSDRSDFSQAVKGLCDDIIGELSSDDVIKILVSSAEPGAGKSVLAANLAQAAAQAGERVLLIDANSAHPTVSALAPVSDPPSLINLGGTVRLAYRLWTGAGSLDLIPLSPAEKRLTRRLVRDQETDCIDGIAGNFDLVIVDGPAAGSGAEPMALAAAADEIIMVAGANTTMADVQPMLRRMRVQGKFRGLVRIAAAEEAQVA
ncbi:MAG: lipopolysaccharide biosynthesis protein [Hyphomicrobiales bacterium]|nr:lipopolysaccharide biosynthesis protein [Hyphomicrobiales bacterium]